MYDPVWWHSVIPNGVRKGLLVPRRLWLHSAPKMEKIVPYQMCVGRHVFAKPPECPVLASYQMWVLPKIAQKRQIPPVK